MVSRRETGRSAGHVDAYGSWHEKAARLAAGAWAVTATTDRVAVVYRVGGHKHLVQLDRPRFSSEARQRARHGYRPSLE